MFVAVQTKHAATKTDNIFLKLLFIKYSNIILSAIWAETFEPNLLAMNNEALVRTFRHGHRYFHQAVRFAAARTGKMWMALVLGTVVG
jgi:hypothetical protein